MYVVVVTDSCKENGKAFACENKQEGVDKLGEIFMRVVSNAEMLDKYRTRVSADQMYAEIWTMMGVTEVRVIKVA